MALALLAAGSPVAISRQILREYLSAVTRPQTWAHAVSMPHAVSAATQLTKGFEVLEDGPQVWAELARLADRFLFGGKQVHDANIVATMLVHGERRLLTFNARDFRRFEPLIEIIEP